MPSSQSNALHFFVTTINENLAKENNLPGAINALLQFGHYLTTHFPEECRGGYEAIQDKLQRDFSEDFAEISISNSLILNAIASARTRMSSTAPESLSEEEKLRWDVDAQPYHWKEQLNHLGLACHCFLPLLNNRGNNHEERNKTPQYRQITADSVKVLEEQAICSANNPIALLDVDETAALSGQAVNRPESYFWNKALFQALYESGVRDVYFLTNYTVDATHGVADRDYPTPSRYLLIQELSAMGFRIHGVLTHHDAEYRKLPGDYYLEQIFPVEYRIAGSEEYKPADDAHFQAARTQETEWSRVRDPNASQSTPKADGYRRLLLSLPPERIAQGFIFVDDNKGYLREVVFADGLPETSLITIHCEAEAAIADSAVEDYKYQIAQLSAQAKEAYQRAWDGVAPSASIRGPLSNNAGHINSCVDFFTQRTKTHGKTLLMLANAFSTSIPNVCAQDLNAAQNLYQLAIIYLEDDRLRKLACENLLKTIIAKAENLDATFDADDKVHAANVFDELRQTALTQKDAIFQYRLALGYKQIASGYAQKLTEYAEAGGSANDDIPTRLNHNKETYERLVSETFDQAALFATTYRKTGWDANQTTTFVTTCEQEKEKPLVQASNKRCSIM